MKVVDFALVNDHPEPLAFVVRFASAEEEMKGSPSIRRIAPVQLSIRNSELPTTKDRGLHDPRASCFLHHACSDVWNTLEVFH